MQVGDLMRCKFPGTVQHNTLCVLVEQHSFDGSFWKILWNDDLLLMHCDHLEAVCK